MSSKPRLSKRDSTSVLRQDTMSPASARKRSGSIASTASRASMFTNPAKHFGLARKASTATLAAAPVSACGIDHGLDDSLGNAHSNGGLITGAGPDRLRPVRQATRATDALRSVQTRAPSTSVPVNNPDMVLSSEPLSAEPMQIPFKGELDTSAPNTPAPSAVAISRTPPRTKFTTPSMTPGFRAPSPAPSFTNKDTTATTKTIPPTRAASRASTLVSEPKTTRLTRKSSLSSVSSADRTTSKRSVSPSPLSLHSSAPVQSPTPTLSAPLPEAQPGSASTKTNKSSSTWLSAIRSTGRPSTKRPSENASQPVAGDRSTALPNEDTTITASAPQSNPTSSGDERGSGRDEPQARSGNAPPVVTNQTALILSPTNATGSLASAGTSTASSGGHALTINTLAAQHAAAVHSPAGWLAWLTSSPSSRSGSPVLVHAGQKRIKGEPEDMVMFIDSDGEEGTDGETTTTPQTTLSTADTLPGGRSAEAGGPSSKGKAKETDQRPEMKVAALSVDNVVPPLSNTVGDSVPKISPIVVQPAPQSTLGLTAAPWRYALQLPLIGRSKKGDPQGKIDERLGQPEANDRDSHADGLGHASSPEVETIIAKYSDDHDFVIVEIEVDGWILLKTEGIVPSSPLQDTFVPQNGSRTWWDYYDYYVAGAKPGPSNAPVRDGQRGPAAKTAGELGSLPPGTELNHDSDARSTNASVFSAVLRPFGRGAETKVQGPINSETHVTAETLRDGKPVKTQAELVKEEALARQSPSVMPALPSPVLNAATKSSWVSYFSNRASRSAPAMSDGRAVKQRAENGGEIEVMHIDEEELSEPVLAGTSNPALANRAPGGSNDKPAPPLTNSPSVKHKASIVSQGKKSSASSVRSTKAAFPNLVLPTFGDTFYTIPRCAPPRAAPLATPTLGSWKLKRTVKNIATQWFNGNGSEKAPDRVIDAEMEEYQRQAADKRNRTNLAGIPSPSHTSSFGSLAIDDFGSQLPRVFSVLDDDRAFGDVTAPVKAVVIGVHGWFPGAIVRSVFGEPTGTSVKFATMGVEAIRQFAEKRGLNLESVVPIPLEGEGTIERRVTKLYDDLLKHPQWLADLQRSDIVFVATHSQGSIVSTHLIARLMADGHIRTRTNREAVNRATEHTGVLPPVAPHRVCCLAMCGIHMGPLYSLNSSSLAQPYLQWFESQAARELFEFQNAESEVSQKYVGALSTALDHGTKFVYVASLNDQVVPIYSGTFVAASHPLILRGLFLDGDAYRSSDFLSNLLVLLLRVKNAGLDEHGLIAHLSEATAGSLSGIGHSTAYEDLGPYTLAVRYLFETTDPALEAKLAVEAFQPRASRNDYEIPWLLHSLMADARISRAFASELCELRDSFADWKPGTAVLRDVQRKLAPIRMSPLRHSTLGEVSKL